MLSPAWQTAICHIAGCGVVPLQGRGANHYKESCAMNEIVYRVPLLGWMLKEAIHGPTTAKILFVVNLLMVWLLAILAFGYPAIIIPALAAVPTMFVVLLLITKG
jgi:hypothetical protein